MLTRNTRLQKADPRFPVRWHRPLFHGGIEVPPGTRIERLLPYLFSRKTISSIFRPMIAEMREEYCESLAQGEQMKACVVRFRGYLQIATAMGIGGVVSFAKRILMIWKSFS